MEKIQRYLNHHKLVLYIIIAFLALLTYLLIVVAQQVSNDQALRSDSFARERGYGFAYKQAQEQLNSIEEARNKFNMAMGTDGVDGEPGFCSATILTRYNKSSIQTCKGDYSGMKFECNKNGIITQDELENSKTRCYTEDELQAFANKSCCGKPALPPTATPIPADPGQPLPPTATPTADPVPPTASACMDTVQVLSSATQRDQSGKCGGVSNTKLSVSLYCKYADGSYKGCSIRGKNSSCIDLDKLTDDIKKAACCHCGEGNVNYTIDTSILPLP